ncbi:MAG: biopolymer transporter ExbD [Thermoguttaceae bacterium]|nr:biopolymer transporter ExbD [Thermoguttaceae bacterium]MDW8078148.1 biopolymer transporter ExbD [Thermoguttaceae bacterium]
MRIGEPAREEGGVELQMTPMIDIVFQLLVFFVMTFKIAAPEGDFNIRMPIVAPSEGIPEPDALPPITIRLTALSDGRLAGIQFGNRQLKNFLELRERMIEMLGPDPGPSVIESTEVELDCDYHLRYEYVIEAITAVSGYVDEKTGQIVKLVEKIKFAPPRAG